MPWFNAGVLEGSQSGREPLPDPAQVEAAARDDARITTIVREYNSFVYRSLLRLGVPSRSAEDATQQVFLVAMRRISEIAEGSEKSFLFGTALRVASDERRRASNREISADLPDGADQNPNPEDNAVALQRRAILQEALLAMPLELRTVFVLFELEQMTKTEVSELLGLPVGTAASRLRRAREMFREVLQKRGFAQGQGE